jgi:hypothetical protein
MGISNRINDWVEDRRKAWGSALGNFLLGALSSGVKKYLDDREPEIIDTTKETIAKILSQPNIPPDLKTLLEKSTQTGDIFTVITGWLMTILGSVFALFQLGGPIGQTWAYAQDQAVRSFRLDPLSVITAWRRDPEKYEAYFNDLKDQGWSDGRIEALKFFTQFYPSPQDLVSWTAREVFEPDAIDLFGLAAEFDKLDLSLFAGAGVSEEQARNYWIAHWEHASFIQVVEMLHRGLLTRRGGLPTEPATKAEWEARDKEGTQFLDDWFRIVEIPPIYRPLLTEMSWNVPTRVDVRRFWDMRTIDEQELYSIYHRQGYRGKDLDNYVLWTKVYTDFPILMAQWTKGWITEDDVRQRLVDLGMPSDRVEDMIREKVRPEVQQDVGDALDLTKTEVYKGVKEGKISQAQGVEIIMRLGKNRATAEFLVDLNTTVLAGSPETFEEYMDLATKYLRAIGKEATPMPEAVKIAADEVVKRTKELRLLKEELDKFNREVIDVEPVPEPVAAKRTELEANVANAEIQLEYAKGRYETELAKWRAGE